MSQEHGIRRRRSVRPVERTARSERAVSPTPSEDVSHLLPPLAVPPEPRERDYGPRLWLEFVLDLVGETPCSRSRLLSVLTDPVLEELGGPELYGRPVGEDVWTFARAAGVPDELAELALGWNMAPRDCEAPGAHALRRCRDELARRLRPLGLRPRARGRVEEAVARGAALVTLREDWDVGVALVLRAPWLRPYDTRDLWDAAHALGMQWGHLEIFHWHNRPGLPGDEYLFSLWSLEEPGTFAPEWVAAGLMVPEVALGFSVPRSPDPIGVFDRMVAAGRYLHARLGGKLLVGPIAIASERTVQLWRTRVRIAADELAAAGFPPGSAKSMQLF